MNFLLILCILLPLLVQVQSQRNDERDLAPGKLIDDESILIIFDVLHLLRENVC